MMLSCSELLTLPGPWLECCTLLVSIASTAWLLRVCSPKSPKLSLRQLWHLGAADMAHSFVQLTFAQIPHEFLCLPKPSLERGILVRVLIHFCLFTLCLVEVQIAATVATSSFQHFAAAGWLAKILPFSWVLAGVLVYLDFLTLPDKTIVHPDGQVTGAAPVVACVMCGCFLTTVVLYTLSVLHLTRTSCNRKVIWEASFQALAYPTNFLVTVFPTWLTHIAVVKDVGYGVHHTVSAVCLYSNGWVNALTYSWQSWMLGERGTGGIQSLDASLLEESEAIAFQVH